MNIIESGFIIDGEVKDLKKIKTSHKKEIIIAAVNNDKLKCFGKAHERD